MTGLPFHPYANLFPLIEGAARIEMVADVRVNGLRFPIIMLDGQILDGRNRYLAAVEAGLIPGDISNWRLLPQSVLKNFKVFNITVEQQDPLSWVLSINLHRRHLSESQRAMVAAGIATLGRGQRTELRGRAASLVVHDEYFADPKPANLPVSPPTQSEAADKLHVSERSVRSARTVIDHGAPGLVEAVKRGAVSVSAAASVAALPETEQREIVARGEKDILAAAKEIRRAKAEKRHGERLARHGEIARGNTVLPAIGKYCVIYADPPWENEVYSEVTGSAKSPDYPTLPLAEIKAMRGDILQIASDAGCALYLWCNTNRLDDGIDVLRGWGFEYVSALAWDKVRIGMGRWFRDQHEMLLVGRLGDIPAPLPGTQPSSVWREKKGEHSAKPAGIRDAIAAMFPGVPKIELFARGYVEGWDVWGNQAAGSIISGPSFEDEKSVVPASVVECARRGRADAGAVG